MSGKKIQLSSNKICGRVLSLVQFSAAKMKKNYKAGLKTRYHV